MVLITQKYKILETHEQEHSYKGQQEKPGN